MTGATIPVDVAVADVNLDGQPDLVVVNECILHEPPATSNCNNGFHGAVTVFLGNPDGTFQRTPLTFDSGGYNPESVAVGDLNGDGKPDLVVSPSGSTGGGYSVLLGNGDGTFQAAVVYTPGGSGKVFLADLNGDGKLDLVIDGCFGTSCSPGVLLGNGDGTFQPEKAIYDSGGYRPTSIAVGDLNGDGKLDLLVENAQPALSDFSASKVGILLGNGDGTFQATTSMITPAAENEISPVGGPVVHRHECPSSIASV